MRVLIIITTVLLMGCNSGVTGDEDIIEPDNVYIVAGQSNASICNWGHFEDISNSKTVKISISGASINELIEKYEGLKLKGLNPAGIIFVHGETDSSLHTNVDVYNAMVEKYRGMISSDVGRDLPLYISTVGYYEHSLPDYYDALRNSVIKNAEVNNKWFIAYNDAKNFNDWGLLSDGLHFTNDGCNLMMEGIYQSI